MNTTQLVIDISDMQSNPARVGKLQIPATRQEELFETLFRDVQPHEMLLIKTFLQLYKNDFIEKYKVPERLMKIEDVEIFTVQAHLKQLDSYK